MTSYKQALSFIYSFPNYETKPMPSYDSHTLNLSRVELVLEKIGNPHRKFPSLLIAGTKGKGSTAAFTESILRAAGYRTGLYVSPHMHTFRERIRIGNVMVTEEEVVEMVERLRSYLDPSQGLTTFEVITIMAFDAFAREGVEIAVLEVGLGGRLDATNVGDPDVSVITSVSYDHVQILGNTLSLIAREKADIIRPGGSVICAPQFPEAMTMVEEVCAENNAELVVVGEEKWRWWEGRSSLKSQRFELGGKSYEISLLGRHQIANAVTAMAAVEMIAEKRGLHVPPGAFEEGLRRAEWPGRFEILGTTPYVVVDSAHNGDSARKLRIALQEYFPGLDVILIFGVSYDKDIRGMLQELLPISRQVFTTRAHHPRSADPAKLAEIVYDMGYRAVAAGSVEESLSLALTNASDTDLVCFTGSIFNVANAREAWAAYNGLPGPVCDPEV